MRDAWVTLLALEYQKAYYTENVSARIFDQILPAVRLLNPLPGLTGHLVLNPAMSPALEKSRNSIPQNQRLTATPASLGVYASIPVNPAKVNPRSSNGTISRWSGVAGRGAARVEKWS